MSALYYEMLKLAISCEAWQHLSSPFKACVGFTRTHERWGVTPGAWAKPGRSRGEASPFEAGVRETLLVVKLLLSVLK